MLSRRNCLARCLSCLAALCAATLLFAPHARAQLSQNSGINSNDTWITFDLLVSTSGSVTMPDSFYDPSTATSKSTLNVAPLARTFHIEAGYDANGGLVMNLRPTDTPIDPDSVDSTPVGLIRIAGGQLTMFAQDGTPISPTLPAGVTSNINWPLSLLGSNPGPSVIQHLVVPNIQTYAARANAQLSEYSGYDVVTRSMPSGNAENWTYVASGSNWVAQKLVHTVPVSGGSVTSTFQFANITWYDNSTNDAVRASKGYTGQEPPAATSTVPSGLTAATQTSSGTVVNQLGGSQNVVFMHGLGSNGGTWNRMTNWLNQDFLLGTEIVPTFDWTQSLSTQGNELVSQINSTGGNGYIAIGHSQGGLVSRFAAQYYQSHNILPAPIKGVVTLDAPNQGAPVVITGPAALEGGLLSLSQSLWDWAGCVTPYDNPVCFLADLTAAGGIPFAGWFYSNGDIDDLVPGSAFLSNLNGFQENFIKAGIVSNTPMRFNEMRILGNFVFGPGKGCYPETACGERTIAGIADYTDDAVLASYVFALIEEIYDPDNYDFWASVADYMLGIHEYMATIDGFYNDVISGGLSSDALVPSYSQNYPSSSAIQYPIKGADSHTGATTSSYVHSTLDQILKGPQFTVPTTADCAFTPSPTAFLIGSSGGDSIFGVSTLAGCHWSAASNTPWISVTGTSSGISSGNISFAVAANPVTMPRTGTITVGNGTASTNFVVQQAALCTYSLSEGPIVTVPSSGGNYTLSVTTQSDCPWSAVSNSPWLTVTAGASGTGPGSFTFAVAPDSSGASLSGTITVMNQTLTVIVGSPVGTPGAGTVTIMGAEQYEEYYVPQQCWQLPPPYGYYCIGGYYAQITETGSVSITVGSDTFTVQYGSSLVTGPEIATALANTINQQTGSPVTATASGSAVTVTSTIAGAATNYPLAISYTYSTQYFSSPAFTAAASGPTLTGGTD